MPVSNLLFLPIPEIPLLSQPSTPCNKIYAKFPPAPPLRTTSTLSRRVNQTQAAPVCQSAPMLAQEPIAEPEPEVTCNNLYVGPLIPKLNKSNKEMSSSENSKLNTQPIYDSLRGEGDKKTVRPPMVRTIITTDPEHPIKKVEPKVIIKPSMMRSLSDPKKNIPRVNLQENVIEAVRDNEEDKGEEKVKKMVKPSQIPTPIKGSKESSSSDSSPSEGSDTGTIVKKL